MIKVSIRRENPSSAKGHTYQSYEILTDRDMTILEALKEIYWNHDGTLAHRHYRCGRRICRSCEVKLDGKNVRGCATLLNPGKSYQLEPAHPETLIRDLVFNFDLTHP